MTINEALTEGRNFLSAPVNGAAALHADASYSDTPFLDASLLLAEVLGLSRENLIIRKNEKISEDDLKKFRGLLSRRLNGECTAYILGRKEFYGLEFLVNRNVLVPRPDTEILFETAAGYIVSEKQKKIFSALDLCTGSGALAIALKNKFPDMDITASDISEKSLEVAEENTRRILGHESKILYLLSDVFADIKIKFGLIVSNPPYVKSGELKLLPPEVRNEPAIALDGGNDGLDIIRKIIEQAPDHLLSDGALFLEADPRQMSEINRLMKNYGFTDIKIKKDLADRERVISGICQN